MAKNIRGKNDRKGGGNDNYVITGRGPVERNKLVKEVLDGKHPHHHILKHGKEKFVRANPDREETNNVNDG
ncbi:MAG: hypothetical protein ACI808_001920 [Paraglaciecola sp.]|jgi:hypothetical protein